MQLPSGKRSVMGCTMDGSRGGGGEGGGERGRGEGDFLGRGEGGGDFLGRGEGGGDLLGLGGLGLGGGLFGGASGISRTPKHEGSLSSIKPLQSSSMLFVHASTVSSTLACFLHREIVGLLRRVTTMLL